MQRTCFEDRADYADFRDCSQPWRCVVLRLAVLIHRGRTPNIKPRPRLVANGDHLELSFPNRWLDAHPLTRLELEQEAQALTAAGITLEFG